MSTHYHDMGDGHSHKGDEEAHGHLPGDVIASGHLPRPAHPRYLAEAPVNPEHNHAARETSFDIATDTDKTRLVYRPTLCDACAALDLDPNREVQKFREGGSEDPDWMENGGIENAHKSAIEELRATVDAIDPPLDVVFDHVPLFVFSAVRGSAEVTFIKARTQGDVDLTAELHFPTLTPGKFPVGSIVAMRLTLVGTPVEEAVS